MCERERESVCVRERECVCVRERECVCERESVSVCNGKYISGTKMEDENGNGKKLNLLNSETEKGKI